ncbi:MAG: PIN domain-containing protein [Cruoricaptor ignavus]|nr:PIN domain-containing protein [Cruoricaptor ignavus]
MMQKVFLDTNIILDFLGEREGFYKTSAKVMTLADLNKIELYTTSNTISTVYYLLSKFENPKTALEKIRKFKVLCNISVTDNEVIEKALISNFKDFEDAIQYFSAIATGCDIIITRNEKDFKSALIPIMNADSYLQSLKK